MLITSTPLVAFWCRLLFMPVCQAPLSSVPVVMVPWVRVWPALSVKTTEGGADAAACWKVKLWAPLEYSVSAAPETVLPLIVALLT